MHDGLHGDYEHSWAMTFIFKRGGDGGEVSGGHDKLSSVCIVFMPFHMVFSYKMTDFDLEFFKPFLRYHFDYHFIWVSHTKWSIFTL